MGQPARGADGFQNSNAGPVARAQRRDLGQRPGSNHGVAAVRLVKRHAEQPAISQDNQAVAVAQFVVQIGSKAGQHALAAFQVRLNFQTPGLGQGLGIRLGVFQNL